MRRELSTFFFTNSSLFAMQQTTKMERLRFVGDEKRLSGP